MRVAWSVVWADGRAVQHFSKEQDAWDFYADYRDWDSNTPKFASVPKGHRINKTYDGPHPNALKHKGVR